MKKHLITVALVAGILTAAGCTSLNVSQPSMAIDSTIKTDIKADIQIGGEITGQSTANVLFGWLKLGGDTQFADGVNYGAGASSASGSFLPDVVGSTKAAAAYKAVSESGADVIIAPRYDIKIENYFIFKTVSVTVKGRKGTIRSIR